MNKHIWGVANNVWHILSTTWLFFIYEGTAAQESKGFYCGHIILKLDSRTNLGLLCF